MKLKKIETFVLASFYFILFIDFHLRDFFLWFAFLVFFPPLHYKATTLGFALKIILDNFLKIP
jgi:hypothetical protein